MLIRLFGRNFRSLKNEFELSMVAADLKRKDDVHRGVMELAIAGTSEPLQLLRCIAIYGPNASGKSTVLIAARALSWLGTDSSVYAKPDARIPPYEPFLLDETSKNDPIELGCDVVFKKSILRYVLRFHEKAILAETLTLLDSSREEKLIDRQSARDVRGALITRSEANRLYVKEMQPNVTVLSKLAQHGPHRGRESVQPYYKAIRNALRYEEYSTATAMQINLGSAGDEKFAKDSAYRDWIMQHLIRSADIGICDVNTRREKLSIPKEVREEIERTNDGFQAPDSRVVVSFVHDGDVKRAIEFTDESAGTKKIFNIASDWWALANEPVTLFADELSASLHPRLLDRLIRAVNDPPTKRMKSQLVFTTHDTGLLESRDGEPPALRRDQVYFTRKGNDGGTELYSLAEFKEDARPVHNIRKRYLSGLYGAIPSVEKVSL